jgi:trehalose 6-phosphate phosphatase
VTRPAWEGLSGWRDRWRRSGELVLLLDFDGTLAPIVERPEAAALPPDTRRALQQLRAAPGVRLALVSGRGLDDVRARAGLGDIAYAGNHGMEIQAPGVRRIHEGAAAARPALEDVMRRLDPELAVIPGAILEDKGLTLSVHHRMVGSGAEREEVERRVRDAAAGAPELRITEGKRVLEIRPRVDWHKGKAVLFLLDHLAPVPGAPVLYMGDDATDEDAFRALAERQGGGDGVRVADPLPTDTAARWSLRDPAEVGKFLHALAAGDQV